VTTQTAPKGQGEMRMRYEEIALICVLGVLSFCGFTRAMLVIFFGLWVLVLAKHLLHP
jgi:hypothetical protein